MVSLKFGRAAAIALVLIVQFSGETLCQSLIRDIVDAATDLLKDGVTTIFQSPTTKALAELETDGLNLYYGYSSERHKIITADGYILTAFRCNSKKPFVGVKKVVVLLPGIFASSDDFSMLPQSLAYVMADAGYDVWMINYRGTHYSRENLYMDPDKPTSGFWNFSFEDMGLKDLPAFFTYVLTTTNQAKLYAIAHSMGTSALLALLAEYPEYNDLIYAASLLAPVAFLTHCTFFSVAGAVFDLPLTLVENREIGHKGSYSTVLGSTCEGPEALACNLLLNGLFGKSYKQRNDAYLPAFLAHVPTGTSTTNFLHYIDEMNYGYFGSRKQSSVPRTNFTLDRITIPVSIHFSDHDTLSNPSDVYTLISMLVNSRKIYVQHIKQIFDHIDFAWAPTASDIVYNFCLKVFSKH